MNIKFLKSPTAAPYFLGYNAGDVANIDDAIALELIQAGMAQSVSTDPPTAKAPHQTAEKPASPAAKAEKRG